MKLGALVGKDDGEAEGLLVGIREGRAVRRTPWISGEEVVGVEVDGTALGLLDGCTVGCLVGCPVGWRLGCPVGCLLGCRDGCEVGCRDG